MNKRLFDCQHKGTKGKYKKSFTLGQSEGEGEVSEVSKVLIILLYQLCNHSIINC